jgi:Tol biopolymer transport system component
MGMDSAKRRATTSEPLAYSVLIALLVLWANGTGFAQEGTRVKEERISSLHPILLHEDSVIPSPDRRRIAYVVQRGMWFTLQVDGADGPAFEGIGKGPLIRWSPDSHHIAYVAERNGKQFVVTDVQVGPPFDGIGELGPNWSPNGRRLAYAAEQRGRWTVVIDGQMGPDFDGIGSLVWSADSRELAYVVLRVDKQMVYFGGTTQSAFEEIGELVLSRDGKRLAFSGRIGSVWRVITNRYGPAFDQVRELRMRPDGQLIYAGQRGNAWYLVTGEHLNGPFEEVGSLALSPDQRRIAFPAKRNGQWDLMVDTRSRGSAELVKDPVWSPDGRRVAYSAKRGEEWRLMLDRVEQPAFSEIGEVSFSSDGRHVAYAAKRWGKWWVVIDGQVGHESHAIWGPIFDGSTVRFLSRRGGEFYRVTVEPAGVPGQGSATSRRSIAARVVTNKVTTLKSAPHRPGIIAATHYRKYLMRSRPVISTVTVTNMGLMILAPCFVAHVAPRYAPIITPAAPTIPLPNSMAPSQRNEPSAVTLVIRLITLDDPVPLRKSSAATETNTNKRNVPVPGPKKPS